MSLAAVVRRHREVLMSSKNLTEEIIEESSSDKSSGLVEYSIDVSSADKVPRLKSVIHRVLEDQKSGRLNLDKSRQPEELISIHEENAECTHVDFNFERQGSEISRMDRKFTDPSEACKVIQHFIRHHKLRKCLHRKNLGDRLIFEANLLRGFRRFLLQLLIFSTLLLSLIVSSNSAAKWGIYSNLRSEFNLDSILSVATRDDLESAIHSVSLVSKKFSTLSSLYFDPGTSGSIELISASESFLRPRLVAGLKLNIGTSFSFTAWIQTSPLFLRGYVVRKRLAAVGAGEPLSCWGWYLTSGAGPQLHFGAHDYFSTSSGRPIDGLAQHAVRLDGTAALRSGEQRLLTMVVTEDNVTFYQDLDVLSVVEMPRPMTDCYDGDEVLLGSAGLQISQGSVYPQPDRSDNRQLDNSLDAARTQLLRAVQDRQALSERTILLQRVESLPHAPAALNPAAQGTLPVNRTTILDVVTGRSYYSLISGRRFLSKPGPGELSRQLDPNGFPSFKGTGMTLSLWYRHQACPQSASACGVYLIYQHIDEVSGSGCWSLWIESNGIYLDSSNGPDPQYFYFQDILPDRFKLTNRWWRHLALILDPIKDSALFYVDGALALEWDWRSRVTNADCSAAPAGEPSGKIVAIGHRFPNFTYGGEPEVYDFRMYLGSGLAASQVAELALASTPELRTDEKCTRNVDRLRDQLWSNVYGHSCSWFFRNKVAYPRLCELPDVAEACPVACNSILECFEGTSEAPVFWVWNSIQRIGRRGANGTLCLGSDPEELLSFCRMNEGRLSPSEFRQWLYELSILEFPRVDLATCDSLAASIDPACSFDLESVQGFTRELNQSGGDLTLAFWIRPLGEESLTQGGRFVPGVHFVSRGDTMLNNQVGFGKYGSSENGEVKVSSQYVASFEGSDLDHFLFLQTGEGVELGPASSTDWTFIAVSLRNSSSARFTTAIVNIVSFSESATTRLRLRDPAALFEAIEITFPALVSPIMLVPKALPLNRLQEVYYTSFEDMALRSGPSMSSEDSATSVRRLSKGRLAKSGNSKSSPLKKVKRSSTTVGLSKGDYVRRSALVAPPIILQQTQSISTACPSPFSSEWILQQHAKAVSSVCTAPFECSDDVLGKPELVISCPGEPVESGTHFGLNAIEFNGRVGFADLLYSIADNDALYRNGSLQATSSFLDTATRAVTLLLVFYTPRYGVTSVLEIQAMLDGPADIHVELTLRHYEIVDGVRLRSFFVVQSFLLMFVMFMVFEVWYDVKLLQQDINVAEKDAGQAIRQAPMRGHAFLLVADLATVILVVAISIMRIQLLLSSAHRAQNIVGGLSGIPWDSSNLPMTQKQGDFFKITRELLDLISRDANVDTFANLVLIINLFRVIKCTALHPRLALLTGTLARALDDLWHTAILTLLLKLCFAAIGYWRFGYYMEAFSSFQRSLETGWDMMMSASAFEGWKQNLELQFYAVIYILVFFLLILNFVLAIIVDAYMTVRKDISDLEIEQEVFTDIFCALAYQVFARIRGWPSDTRRLGEEIQKQKAVFNVGYSDLARSSHFSSRAASASFVKYYRQFQFLRPISIPQKRMSKVAKSSSKHDNKMNNILDEDLKCCASIDNTGRIVMP